MLVRRIARPLLASIFVTEGVDTLRNPGPRVKMAEPVIDLVAETSRSAAQKVAAAGEDVVDRAASAVDERVQVAAGKGAGPATASAPDGAMSGAATSGPTADTGGTLVTGAADRVHGGAEAARTAVHDVAAGRPLPFDTETYVKVNAAVQVGAGVLLSIGRMPRVASAALAASLIPTTYAGHRFWEVEGPERHAQRIQFMKNLCLMGGLILAAVDTEGRPGLAWKAGHLGQEAKVAGSAARMNATLATKAARANAKAVRRLAKANAKAAGRGGRLGVEVAGDRLRMGAERAAEVVAPAAGAAGEKLRLGAGRAAEVVGPAAEAAGRAASAGASRASSFASDLAADLSHRLPATH